MKSVVRCLLLLVFCFSLLVSFAQGGGNGFKKYTVRKKATVETIAFLNDVTVADLLRANPTVNPNAKLKPGAVLIIPVKEDVSAKTPVESTASVSTQKPSTQKPSTQVSTNYTSSSQTASDSQIASNNATVATSSGKSIGAKSSASQSSSKGQVSGYNSKGGNAKSQSSEKQVIDNEDEEDEEENANGGVQTDNESPSDIDTKPLTNFSFSQKTITIAVLLPFEKSSLSQSMVELYSGMVMAASDAEDGGEYDVILKAYSTSNLENSYLDDILSNVDVIVGPVHESDFIKVAKWAKINHKPIVSPLSSFDVPDNNYVISVAPFQSTKNQPLVELCSGDKNIVMIQHSEYPNKKLEADLLKIAPHAEVFRYVREEVTPQDIAPLLDQTRENIIFVPTDHQGAIEDVVSKITATNSPIKLFNISIVGSSAWLNLSNFSQELLFRGNVSCLSSYYFDRQDNVVESLFDDYINAYERIPGRFAMRGYDVVNIVFESMQKWGREMLVRMNGSQFTPLQTPYQFEMNKENGNIQNTRWVLVSYNQDYSIKVR